jgi:hypothetical protein
VQASRRASALPAFAKSDTPLQKVTGNMCKLVRVPPVVKPPQFSQAVVRVLARQVVQRVAYKMHVAALPGRQIQKKILIVIAAEEEGAGIGRIRLHPIATVSGKPCDRVVVGEIGVATNAIDLFVAGCIEDDAAMCKGTGNMSV